VSVWEGVREAVSLGNYAPALRPTLVWMRLRTRRGSPYTMLADRPRRYLRLGPEDDYVVSRMDGSRRVSDLVVDYFRHFGRFAFDRIATLVTELRRSGFLREPPQDVFAALARALHPEPPRKRGRWEGTPLRLRLPLRGINGLVTRVHDRIGWIFFMRPVLYLSVAVTFAGLIAFIAELRRGANPFAPLGTSHLAGLVALVIGYYAAVLVHESGHALTCKHFGGRVDEGGFMLYYLVPAFYVNVTDSWLVPWYKRIAVFWAGPYSGFVLAGLGSILVWFLPAGVAATLIFKLATVAYINNAFNLMPLLQLDGYWILEEWLETPRLRQRALDFVRGPMWQLLIDRKPFTRREAFYTIFGILCAVYSFLAIYLAFLYWGRRLKPIVRPLWSSPSLLAKLLLAALLVVVAIPLGIRLGRVLMGYQRRLRKAPAAARKALIAIRVRDRLRLLDGLGFLASLPSASIERLARSATVREVATGTAVVRQGERGDEFFILARGQAEVVVRELADDRVVASLQPGDFFGEGALLGTGVRQATVRALTPSKLLVFGQRTFWAELAGPVGWQARVRTALEERKRLQGLPLFADASPRQLDLLAIRLQIRPFQPGETLVREGEVGDAFYIVREGSLEVEAAEGALRRQLTQLQPGDFFGEIALLRAVPRTATVRGASAGSVWRLGREDFRDLLGRYLELESHMEGIASSRLARGHSMPGAA